MPAKKPARAKKPVSGKRTIGLTSAIGPKATTIVVICVMAGGILVAARQQPKAKSLPEAAMSAEIAPAANTVASKKTANSEAPGAGAAVTTGATAVTVTAAMPKAPVTITGCLERADEGFRLKDTVGANAPKARSWKSGFLKKGSATLDVVDAAHALNLVGQVGHRVSLTGTVVDREMQARSVRRVAASCDQRPGA
jgi:hypothetical protein